MSTTSNRSILEKADLAIADLTAGGGILKPTAAKRFLRLLIKQSVLMQWVTAVPMSAPEQSFPRIKFGDRVLRPDTGAALPLAQRSRPDISSVQLRSQRFKAEVWLPDDVLEDNLEQGELRQTIMTLLTEKIASDMEDVVINGDTASGDPTLAQLDGILKQAVSHVVDAAGAPLDKSLMTDMLKSLPSEYMRARSQMRFLTSVDAELDYRNSLADRETAAGDAYLESEKPIVVSGIRLASVPHFPETLGAATDQTVALLTPPKNIYVGIRKRVKLETQRDVSEGVLKVVARMGFDVRYADENAVSKMINVQL